MGHMYMTNSRDAVCSTLAAAAATRCARVFTGLRPLAISPSVRVLYTRCVIHCLSLATRRVCASCCTVHAWRLQPLCIAGVLKHRGLLLQCWCAPVSSPGGAPHLLQMLVKMMLIRGSK